MHKSNFSKITINGKQYQFHKAQKMIIDNTGNYSIVDYHTGNITELAYGSIYSNSEDILPITTGFLKPVSNSISSFKKTKRTRNPNRIYKGSLEWAILHGAQFILNDSDFKITNIYLKYNAGYKFTILSCEQDFIIIDKPNPFDKLQIIINDNYVIYCILDNELGIHIDKVYYEGRFIYKDK